MRLVNWPGVLSRPHREVAVLLVAKAVRTYAYGFMGIVLPLHLSDLGAGAPAIGAAVTLTLLGSAALTWAARWPAERQGPRAALIGLAVLGAVGGGMLLMTGRFELVVLAAMIANVAVGTGETGPFLALEQVLVVRAARPGARTMLLSVYNLVGYAAGALGALSAGLAAPRVLFAVFLASAAVQVLLYTRLPAARPAPVAKVAGAPTSAGLIRRLAALFALDSFAGGFVLTSLVAYYLHVRFGLGLEVLGWVFFAAQILTAVSLLLAARWARRFGLLNTMVWSHLASNALLVAVAFAPTALLAVGLLLARNLLSQMDVPTRQAYVMAVVEDAEREAAATVTNLARTLAQAVSPALTGWVMASLSLAAPFVLGGTLKIAYDLLLYATFRKVPLRAERG